MSEVRVVRSKGAHLCKMGVPWGLSGPSSGALVAGGAQPKTMFSRTWRLDELSGRARPSGLGRVPKGYL